jgi:hypothetical protein
MTCAGKVPSKGGHPLARSKLGNLLRLPKKKRYSNSFVISDTLNAIVDDEPQKTEASTISEVVASRLGAKSTLAN